MKTILVIGDLAGSAAYHAGDEAMVEADTELLRLIFPEVNIIVTSLDPTWSGRALACDAIQSGTFKSCKTEEERVALFEASTDSFLSIIADVDAVVIAGGGNLTSTWPEHLYERALFAASAVKLLKPVIILGQTLGPRLRPNHTALLRDMLRSASLVGVREAVSAGIASSLGVEDNRMVFQADDALFLSPTVPPEFPAGFDPTSRWLAVTVHPFATLGSLELSQFAAELVRGVGAQKIGLLFVPHARAGEGGDGISDVDIAAELARLTGGWALPCPTAREAVWAAQHAYAVISTRYHPLVFASSGGVPFLSLPSDAYTATKCLGAQAHVGLVPWSLGLSRAIAGELSQAVGELIQRRDELSAWLTAALPHLHNLESQRRFALRQCFAEHGFINKNRDERPVGHELPAGAPRPLGLWACIRYGSPCDELLEQFQPAAESTVLYIESLTEALKFSKQAQASAESYAESLENALQAAQPVALDAHVESLTWTNAKSNQDQKETNMAPLAACTIVAHNYLPLARVLARSFLDQHPSATFVVAVIDHPLVTRTLDEEFFEVIPITDIDFGEEGFEDMAVCYDVTEFATAVKPFVLRQLLDAFECVLYLDPDIYVYAPLTPIVEATMTHGISLTPHCLEPMAHDGMGPTEAEIMAAGIYNLGYIGVSCAARPFLDWWAKRLRRGALNDPSNQLFTDQRWVDLAIPVYSPYIERSPAYNVAYWNIDQRMLWIKDHVPMIDGEPLRFFHFSGYEPNTPHWLCKYQVHTPRTLLSEHATLATLCTEYGAALKAAGYGQPGLRAYGWSQAFPQLSITKPMRRMFHGELVKSDLNSVTERPPSPFKANGAKLFRDWLCTVPKDGSLPLPRFLQLIWRARADLRAQFPEAFGGDMTHLLFWLQRTIEPEAVELRVLCAQFVTDSPYASSNPLLRQQGGVNLIGYLKAELGVGEAGRLVHSALTSVGVAVSTFACQGSKNRHADPFQLSGQASHGITLLSVNADQVEPVRKQFEASFFDNRYVIGQWFWEVEKFPQIFDRAFSLLDEVWVATKYIQSAISLANPSASVHLMPLPLIAPTINTAIRKVDFGLDERFAFLFSFDMNSVFERKNPIGLVMAFCHAFTSGEGPVLIIKIINGDSNLNDLEKLRWTCRDRIDIKIIDQYFDATMMGSLMAVCDCYVSLHRAEGLGLTMAQAMCLGKPVIATAYSGNMDFMREDTAYLIPWTPIKVGTGCPPYPEEAMWADPDLSVAAHTMREVASFPDRAMIRGNNARTDLATRFSPQVTGKRMHQRLQHIWDQEHA